MLKNKVGPPSNLRYWGNLSDQKSVFLGSKPICSFKEMTQQDNKKFYKLPNPIQDAWLHARLYSNKHRKFYRNILDTSLSK